MVIQSNMSSKEIVKVWQKIIDVFKKYNVPLSEIHLSKVVGTNNLTSLLQELNAIVGSSSATCIEGG